MLLFHVLLLSPPRLQQLVKRPSGFFGSLTCCVWAWSSQHPSHTLPATRRATRREQSLCPEICQLAKSVLNIGALTKTLQGVDHRDLTAEHVLRFNKTQRYISNHLYVSYIFIIFLTRRLRDRSPKNKTSLIHWTPLTPIVHRSTETFLLISSFVFRWRKTTWEWINENRFVLFILVQ